jgi:hypothetical protein
VGPRAVLDAVVKRKTHSPCQESNPRNLTIIGRNHLQVYRQTYVITFLGNHFVISNKVITAVGKLGPVYI